MKYYSLQCKTDLNGKYSQLAEGLLVEKQSKFYSYVFAIKSEEEAIEKIEQIKKDNISARHVVYIYSYLKDNVANIRFSDDGEPKGTGTKAIYELLDKEAITNICIVIVRYFGGILLGAGPLSRAYLNSAREALDLCNKKEIYNYSRYSFKCSYNAYNVIKNKVQDLIDSEYINVLKCEFSDNIYIEYDIEESKIEEVKKIVEEVCYDY